MENKKGTYLYGELRKESVRFMYFEDEADMIECLYFAQK